MEKQTIERQYAVALSSAGKKSEKEVDDEVGIKKS